MRVIHLTPDQVPSHLKGAYNGKKFKAEVTTEVTIPADAGLWSGGSRDTYRLVCLANGADVAASDNMSSPWNRSRQDQTIALVSGIAVVRSTMFRGNDLGLTFYVHPSDAAQLLPAPSAELSEHEQIVLNATCSFKSSHNGKDRYELARGYDRPSWFPTRDEWNAAKASLIAKGLLNKAGAVTPAGRNARK